MVTLSKSQLALRTICIIYILPPRSDENGIPVCTSGGEDLQCPCKENFGGAFCDECAEGFFNFPECTRELTILGGDTPLCLFS